MNNLVPKEMQFDGDHPFVTFKNTSRCWRADIGCIMGENRQFYP